jgi:ABC-type sugar transport systems, permease components
MNSNKAKLRGTLTAYGFMAPALILVFTFVFMPILLGIPLTLTNYSAISDMKFIGFQNFIRAFHDPEFWIAVKNSILFVLVVPPIQILSILLAVLVNRKISGISFFRVLFYIPVVTSMVAVSIMWSFLFDPSGIVNNALQTLGLINAPILFLGDAHIAMISLMFITIWQGLGYYMMLYLSGLQSVPEDIVEAAKIDGASGLRILWKIKIPLLKPYVWFCSLNSIISAINVFDIVFVITQGGPDNATLVTNYYSYYKAFNDYEFGYAATVGLLLSLVTLSFSLIVFLYGRRGGMNNDE